MFLLGLLLPIVYVPSFTGATVPTQWVLLGIFLGWQFLRFGTGLALTVGLGVIAYSAASITWAPVPYHSGYGLWTAVIWCLSFWFGTCQPNLGQLWRGLSVGLSISSCVAIAQAFGFTGIPYFSAVPAGLLYNSTLQATCIAVVILGLGLRQWRWWIAMLPGLYLAHSRGGYAVLTIGLLARIHWSLAALALTILGLHYGLDLNSSDTLRLQIWSAAWTNLTPLGHGIGSFADLYIAQPPNLVRPEFTHNDYLQLAFELGIGAIPIFAVLALAATQGNPQLIALLVCGAFYFPLHCPILAFLTFVLAGDALRSTDRLLVLRLAWRSLRLPRFSSQRFGYDSAWNQPLPLQSSGPKE